MLCGLQNVLDMMTFANCSSLLVLLFLVCVVYLILGLIVMLVVLETFCELQQLKQLRKMFYLKKEKPQDRLAILEHDHLSFTTVSCGATGQNEGKTQSFVSVPTLASPNDDPMIQ